MLTHTQSRKKEINITKIAWKKYHTMRVMMTSYLIAPNTYTYFGTILSFNVDEYYMYLLNICLPPSFRKLFFIYLISCILQSLFRRVTVYLHMSWAFFFLLSSLSLLLTNRLGRVRAVRKKIKKKNDISSMNEEKGGVQQRGLFIFSFLCVTFEYFFFTIMYIQVYSVYGYTNY